MRSCGKKFEIFSKYIFWYSFSLFKTQFILGEPGKPNFVYYRIIFHILLCTSIIYFSNVTSVTTQNMTTTQLRYRAKKVMDFFIHLIWLIDHPSTPLSVVPPLSSRGPQQNRKKIVIVKMQFNKCFILYVKMYSNLNIIQGKRGAENEVFYRQKKSKSNSYRGYLYILSRSARLRPLNSNPKLGPSYVIVFWLLPYDLGI